MRRRTDVAARARHALWVHLSRSAPAFRGSYRELQAVLGYRSGAALKADLDAVARLGYVALPGRLCHPSVIRIVVPFIEIGGTS